MVKTMTIHKKHYPPQLSSKLQSVVEDNQVLKEFEESRLKLSTDIDRPLYHFSPPQNSLNDPNGLCEWQGAYLLGIEVLSHYESIVSSGIHKPFFRGKSPRVFKIFPTPKPPLI